MSHQTEWTVGTLKEYLERILEERDKALGAALSAAESSTRKAEEAQQGYNVRSNEFRAALGDQGKLMLTRTEAEVRFDQLRERADEQANKIAELQKQNALGEGQQRGKNMSLETSKWILALVVTVALSAIGGIGTLIFYMATRK